MSDEMEFIDQGSEATDFTDYLPTFSTQIILKTTENVETPTSLNGNSYTLILLLIFALYLIRTKTKKN